MSDFRILLEVDSVDISTLAITTHYHSDGPFVSGASDTPANTQYTPNLVLSRLQFYHQAISLPGKTGGGKQSDSGIEVKLARYIGSTAVDRLTEYDGEELVGRDVRLLAVGTLPDGTVTTLASPRVLVGGSVSDWLRTQDQLSISITRKPSALSRVIPNKSLLGYRDGLWFDGTNDYVDAGFTSLPTDFTIMVRTLVPRGYSGVSSITSVFGNVSVEVGLAAYATRKMFLGYANSVGTFIEYTDGPSVPDVERYYWLCLRFEQGVGFSIFLDEDKVDVSYTSTIFDYGFNWFVGNGGQGLFTHNFLGVISCSALFDTNLTDDEIFSYQRSRLEGDEDNLILFYPGESLSTTLYDYAAANDPPLDGVITGAVAVSTGEGDQNVAGNLIPIAIGYCRNCLGIPVDPTVQMYRFADTCQKFVQVRDRGAPFTISAEYHSFDSFRSASPTAGNVVVYPEVALVKVGGTLSDQAVITADIAGESLYDYSIGFKGNTYVTFGTGLNDVFLEPHSISFDLFPTDVTDNQLIIGNAGTSLVDGVSVVLADASAVGGRKSITYAYVDTGTGLVLVAYFEFSLVANEPMNITFTADEVAGDIVVRLYINGKLYGDHTEASSAFPASSAAFSALSMGRVSTVDESRLDLSSVGRMMLWSKALNQDEIRQYLFETPDPSTTNLEAMWLGSDTITTSLPDEVGSNDGTFNGAGPHVWHGGVTQGWPIATAVLLLNRYADVDLSQIEIRNSAWLGRVRGSSLYIDSEGTVEDYVNMALASIGGWCVSTPDYAASIGSTRDPDDLAPSTTIYSHEISEVERLRTSAPEEIFAVGYAPNWHIQPGNELVASVNDTQRSFYSKEIRLFESRQQKNATRYPPSGRIFSAGGLWSARPPAIVESRRLRTVHGFRPEFFRVTMRQQLTNIFPGDVVTINHDDIDSSGSPYMVISVTATIGDEIGDILEVWRPT